LFILLNIFPTKSLVFPDSANKALKNLQTSERKNYAQKVRGEIFFEKIYTPENKYQNK